MINDYDAILWLSFGGPESKEDVIPFLENVLRGRNVPRTRMLEVAEHYYKYAGKSPINDQNKALIEGLEKELEKAEIKLPVYWGNRNWDPLLKDTVEQMKQQGVQRVLAFVTSAFCSYSGCLQYQEDIDKARQKVGEGAPEIEKIRTFYNHPLYIEGWKNSLQDTIQRHNTSFEEYSSLLFTAHSIPLSMAQGCDYEQQLHETARLVSQAVGLSDWELVYQSRSGAPHHPWLEPDVCDYLEKIGRSGEKKNILLVPLGFLSDHLEVLYDLDVEAKAVCEKYQIPMIRALAVGTQPVFSQLVRELISERLEHTEKRVLGKYNATYDVCPVGCCAEMPKTNRG